MTVPRVARFVPAMAPAWDEVNRAACNGHFQFDRAFVGYHAHRFEDRSVMLLDDDAPLAILAAHRAGDHLASHLGLTFGGLVYSAQTRLAQVSAMLDALLAHARAGGASAFTCKLVPSIYHDGPAEDQLYALWRAGGALVRREITTAIDYRAPGPRARRRARGVRRADTAGLSFGWDPDLAAFWAILTEVLRRRHGAAPTHSLTEIGGLAASFPARIRLFAARAGAAMLAGVLMFESRHVAHAQYIAASPDGQAAGALDGVFDRLIRHYETRSRYFDFGISTEAAGRRLNEGLAAYKEEWGGRGVVHDCYEVPL